MSAFELVVYRWRRVVRECSMVGKLKAVMRLAWSLAIRIFRWLKGCSVTVRDHRVTGRARACARPMPLYPDDPGFVQGGLGVDGVGAHVR